VLVVCPKAKVDGNSNIAVIKKNKKDPADAENKAGCSGELLPHEEHGNHESLNQLSCF
jgi:hypothetical protein